MSGIQFLVKTKMKNNWNKLCVGVFQTISNELEWILRSSQNVYGSPTYPNKQTQMARWFLTLHSAFRPQELV